MHLALPTVHSSPPIDASKLRVLVVDDNVDGAESLCAVLEWMGCSTAAAFNGAQGLALAGRFDPHLALIDLEMPDMTGCDVARQLRMRQPRIPVTLVCITGRGGSEDRGLCIDAGFDDFYTKPMDPDRLAEVVQSANAGLRRHEVQA